MEEEVKGSDSKGEGGLVNSLYLSINYISHNLHVPRGSLEFCSKVLTPAWVTRCLLPNGQKPSGSSTDPSPVAWLLQPTAGHLLLKGLSTVCFLSPLSQRWMVLDMFLFGKYEVSRGHLSVKQRCRKADIVTVQTRQPEVQTKEFFQRHFKTNWNHSEALGATF